jgi:hypothetical protein
MHLITGPAPHRPQTRPPRKTQGARRPSGHGARLVGRGRRLMHLLGTGPVVPGEKGKSAKSRNDPIRGSAAKRRPSGGGVRAGSVDGGSGGALGSHPTAGAGRKGQIGEIAQRPYTGFCRQAPTQRWGSAGGQCAWRVGVASAVTRPLVPGEMRESTKSRNDPIRGSAAKRRPSRGAVRADGVDAASRGCPRPSPDCWCPARSANRRNRATTPYGVLSPSAAP